MAASTRRRLFGVIGVSFVSALLLAKRAHAAPAAEDDFVVVNGWILKRSDLDLIR